MNRQEALELIRHYVKNENSIKHMLAVEAIMSSLADKFKQDKNTWKMAGLLHDIDMEIVDYKNEPEKHELKSVEILESKGIDNVILEAIKAHNEATNKKRESLLEKAIYCTDPLTGLIVASVLVLPSRKIKDLNVESLSKRFKENAFARGAKRDIIASCSEIDLSLEDFLLIGLEAMKEISHDLGL